MNERVHSVVVEIARKYAGKMAIEDCAFIDQDLGIVGDDCVEFIEELEGAFEVDLRPLVERGPLQRQSVLRKILGVPPQRSGADVTISELVEFISHSRKRNHLGSS